MMNKLKSILFGFIIGLFAIGALALFVFRFDSLPQLSTPFTSYEPTPALKPIEVVPEKTYQNPFDENTIYENPFSDYQNPFETE